MKTNNYINTITFSIKTLPATNNNGTRVKIAEIKRYNNQKNNSVTLSYNHEIDNPFYQGLEYLEKVGAKIIGYSSNTNEYLVFCNNWGDDYITLKK